MLTGQPPFLADTDVTKMFAILSDPRPVLSERRPGLPTELDAVIARAMAINQSYRYPSAGDFARAARAAMEARQVATPEREVARGAAASTAPSEPLPASLEPSPPGQPAPSEPLDGHRTAPRRPPISRRALALAGGAVLAAGGVAALIVVLAGGGRKGGSSTGAPATPMATLVMHPAGAPLSFTYPANFKTTGLTLTVLTGPNGYAGLDPDNFLGVSQSDVGVDTRGLTSNGVAFTRRQETHAGLTTDVVNFDSTDKTTNAAYHERDYYFVIRGLSWDLTCVWTAARASVMQQACQQAIDSVQVS
jgi:hypothetical protein